MERHEEIGLDDTFYQTVIRFAEDVIVDRGVRTDPADFYNYMEAPTPPRWEADYNDLHFTVQHFNLGKHESKPYGVEHASKKYGRKTLRIRPSEQLLGGITLKYWQTTDGELELIEAQEPRDDLLTMELHEYVDDY